MDLFIDYKNQPLELQKICQKWNNIRSVRNFNYKDCEKFLNEVLKVGYVFQYGLDAEPYELIKINN